MSLSVSFMQRKNWTCVVQAMALTIWISDVMSTTQQVTKLWQMMPKNSCNKIRQNSRTVQLSYNMKLNSYTCANKAFTEICISLSFIHLEFLWNSTVYFYHNMKTNSYTCVNRAFTETTDCSVRDPTYDAWLVCKQFLLHLLSYFLTASMKGMSVKDGPEMHTSSAGHRLYDWERPGAEWE